MITARSMTQALLWPTLARVTTCSLQCEMKNLQGLQVSLRKPDSFEAYAEVKHGFTDYAVGQPGEAFNVHVTIPQAVFARCATIEVRMHLEGRCPGVTYTLNKTQPFCAFKGYKTFENGQHRFRQFVFAQPGSTSSPGSTLPSERGQLRVTFTHVVEHERYLRTKPSAASLPSTVAHCREGTMLTPCIV